MPASEVAADHSVRCLLPPDLAEAAPPAQSALGAKRAIGTAPVLEVKGLSKIFRGPARLWGAAYTVSAVQDFSLTLRPGEFVGIVGESGSGKSTIAKMLVGLLPSSAGEILIDGKPAQGNARAARELRTRNIQMVFQDPQSALNPRRTLANLVTYAMTAGASRYTAAERMARARTLLEETGLSPELATRYPSQVSGGQRQRVNIARALCHAPRILVADEILSGLDLSVQAQILMLLLKLREEMEISLILVSHDIAAVRYLCDRVVVLQHGVTVESGEVDAVLADARHDYTRRLVAAIPPDDPDILWPRERSYSSVANARPETAWDGTTEA